MSCGPAVCGASSRAGRSSGDLARLSGRLPPSITAPSIKSRLTMETGPIRSTSRRQVNIGKTYLHFHMVKLRCCVVSNRKIRDCLKRHKANVGVCYT